ncbi:DUF881 domain-containing protein [Dehalobacterium formicoaceticum]|uniref:DUF881 domain-containing protein n=1 Tax=Dehalobacterium formicoaceticum TaxID=51515 RepID=A0ABT1Y0H4_9FIRM|nr:DUF881 domain-containing protein [Dehalobacterium formicoaceticum]MCR6544372.1 DUF881 domain-containing protein [Dehalobacterium formicoaceticum]
MKLIKKEWRIPLFIALLMFGLLVSTQYSTNQALENSLASQSEADLVTLVKSLNEKRVQLETDYAELSSTKRSLVEKATAGSNLASSLTTELSRFGVVSGTVPLHGPGLVISITGDSNLIDYDLIDLVNELWVSGAEAVAINEHRILYHTLISQGTDENGNLVITVDNKPLLSPVIVKVIGDPDTLEKGLTFTGGIIDNFNTLFQVFPVIKKQEDVVIPAAAPPKNFSHLKEAA